MSVSLFFCFWKAHFSFSVVILVHFFVKECQIQNCAGPLHESVEFVTLYEITQHVEKLAFKEERDFII